MRKFKFLMPIGFLVIAGIFGLVVMLLWNWLMPAIFGLACISFWQALGILVLARILFGGFGGKKGMGPMHHHKNPLHDKWMQMTPEQQKEFIERRRKFGFGHPMREDFCKAESQADAENKESGNKNE